MSRQSTWREKAHKKAGWIVALGILQIVAGVLALFAPLAGGIVTTIMIGAGLLAAGVAGLVAAFQADSFGTGVLAFLWALVLAAGGVGFLFNPGAALATLTLVAAAMFLVSGIAQVIGGFQMRPDKGWGWLLTGGVLGVLMAVMVWRSFPFSGVWFIGTLVGIQLLFTGMSTLTLGGVARDATSAPAATT